MGKQINYWLNHEEFLQIAQAALDCGCVIMKKDSGKIKYGKTLDMVTEDWTSYYFYLPEAGSLMAQQIPFQGEPMFAYNAAGNTVIQAGFSHINDDDIISKHDIFQEEEWKHKVYISPSCLTLKVSKHYKLV